MAHVERVGEVKSVFRALLRARKRCFAGDEQMLNASAQQIRSEFDQHRQISDQNELHRLLQQARETVEFLALNVVQAKLNDRGNYEMKLSKEHAGTSLEEPDLGKLPSRVRQ
ncbi:hypothetical protein O6H91_05G031700 [Diphasiastrum complanatum]|uniref:Uncharacterized protein n=2 Tax=Diphasiastrum complanatum TaxID=34168 RepID=A0ACC2AR98_DIPCM|nr:hypothetical protein O6H91_20G068300 [Diphasiastrum complanatum]KAJ7555317.1 hypothetical protein O6H91_05G031700 [Diphasiastrum complanatum]